MTRATAVARGHADLLLELIGISRIVLVDDEYAEEQLEVEELIGLCTGLSTEAAATLPHLESIDFGADSEIWAGHLRDTWKELEERQRRETVEKARALETKGEHGGTDETWQEDEPRPLAGAPVEEKVAIGGDLSEVEIPVDTRAAQTLEELLQGLERCSFVPLSLKEWRVRASQLLADEQARATVFLFDRDFRRERGSENEGFMLVRDVQEKGVGMCGLITHTIPLGGEYAAWARLAREQNLDLERFVVIAKERLTGESPDHYSFLRMVRLAALSGRCAAVKNAAWTVFEASLAEAKAAVECLGVLDFEQIVLASSRREGVWEPDTLFRVFGILMRREARRRLHGDQDADVPAKVANVRRVSAVPKDFADALGEEPPSRGTLQIQRFEAYEDNDTLNAYCLPLELGDIFETTKGRRYVLLAQPCDLMVRPNGRRSYEDDTYGRCAALVELLVGRSKEEAKESWAEVPFFDEVTGAPAYADFSRAHQVLLAVLDLCVWQENGEAEIDLAGSCPAATLETWKQRYERVRKRVYKPALDRYKELSKENMRNVLRKLALPRASSTLRIECSVDGSVIRYRLKRVMRLNQPRSGALLTSFAHYQSRAAFEHPLDHRLPVPDDGEVSGGAEGE